MHITVAPYDTNWPNLFHQESEKLHSVLGDQLVDIHHIGSTAIPGIWAKPVIDIIPVVKDIASVDRYNPAMKAAGYIPMGEYGIPFRRYFQKDKDGFRTHNIHVFEHGNLEIERHLAFRDYMRSHPKEAEAYSVLKQQLAVQFPNDIRAYCDGKDHLIRQIDNAAGFSGLRMVQVASRDEWEFYHALCKTSIFDGTEITYDPHHPTLHDPNYTRFILLKGTEYIGILVTEFLEKQDAILRMVAIDPHYRNAGLGTELAKLGERWLAAQGRENIYLHANPTVINFYRRFGYKEMPLPNGNKSIFKNAVDMGKGIT